MAASNTETLNFFFSPDSANEQLFMMIPSKLLLSNATDTD